MMRKPSSVKTLSLRIVALLLIALIPMQTALAMPADQLQPEDAQNSSSIDTKNDHAQGRIVLGKEAPAPAPSYLAEVDSGVQLSAEFFPDPNFRDYLMRDKFRGVREGGALTQSQLDQVTNIACSRKDIHSLTGIEYFPNLNYLYCEGNQLTTIDVSHNPLVATLHFDNNPVSQLILNEDSRQNLTSLSCWNTKLTHVDTAQLPNLRELICGSSGLDTLNLSNNAALESLTYYRGSISSLDLRDLPNLKEMIWSDTPVDKLDLGACQQLYFLGLRKNELTVLDVSGNGSFDFLSAPMNHLVSVHGNPSATYYSPDLSNQNPYSIGVSGETGSFDMAALDPKFAQGTVTNLSAGTLDGSMLSGLAPGQTVTYTYTDGGLSVDAVLSVTEGNYWTQPLQIIGWIEGDVPNQPTATALHGTPTFSYAKAGGEFSSTVPTEPGEWICRATVPGTASYGPLTTQVSFIITQKPEEIPVPQGITGTYRSTLGSIALPEGYSWLRPGTVLTQDIGRHEFPATYTRPDGVKVPKSIPVEVTPADGTRCWISPLVSEDDIATMVVRDGTFTLTKGVDYSVTSSKAGNLVTVTISFMGNYYGTAVRTFTTVVDNAWVTPLSIDSWIVGQPPKKPIATAKHGTPEFSYLVNGQYQSDPPTEPGTYVVRAEVAGTQEYGPLVEEADFFIYQGQAPDVQGLEATYGDHLSDVALPGGFSWKRPDMPVGNVGTNSFPAQYVPESSEYMGGDVDLSVQVHPKNGELCDISPITNEYESKHIVIRDGSTVLTKGVDYTVSSSVESNVVTVRIDFIGNYYGTVTRTFTFQGINEWIIPLSIANWSYGQTPADPVAEAKYGTVQFSYLVHGTYQSEPPTEPGVYVVRALVPATVFYPEISTETTFRIFRGIAPDVEGLEAIYRDTLSDVELPQGFSWNEPQEMVGDVGVNEFPATFTTAAMPVEEDFMGGSVDLDVAVAPKNGELCDISAITNEYDSRHIKITDGDYTLIKGRDYTVSSDVRENVVTVAIHFENNYYNTVTESFTFSVENSWVEPLSIDGWSYGEPPNAPVAAAAYGEPKFTYLVDGSEQSEPPTQVGTYTVRATVPATVYYPELVEEEAFSITPAKAPIPSRISAVYRDRLSDLTLPNGYRWVNPNSYVGDVGERSFAAVYTPAPGSNYVGGRVGIPVLVGPKNGDLCTISSITNVYESHHIVITDGDYTLLQHVDYQVVQDRNGNTVTVRIEFIHNYYGTATRTFSFGDQNYWTVPLSIRSWRYGDKPSVPIAQAKYGTPEFSYLVQGKYVADPPTEIGEYFVRAVVPGTDTYGQLTAQTNFEILPAQSPGMPSPSPSPGPSPSQPPGTPSPGPDPSQSPEEGTEIAVKDGIDAVIEPDSRGKVLEGSAITANTTGTSPEAVLDLLEILPVGAQGKLQIVGPDGAVLSGTDIVGTGCQVQLLGKDGTVKDSVTVVLRGDVIGSGVVNIAQMVQMAQDLNHIRVLEWPFDLAADFNDNDRVDIADLVREAAIINGE